MEKKFFYLFLAIALLIGIAAGTMLYKGVLTGAVIAPQWLSNLLGTPTTPETTTSTTTTATTPTTTSSVEGAQTLFNYKAKDGVNMVHCSSTNDFNLEDEHSVFHLSKCDRAIFTKGATRKEITLHGIYVDAKTNSFLAHIQYKEFIDGELCIEQDVLTAPYDSGFAVDVIEARSKTTKEGNTLQMVLAVMPEGLFEDYCSFAKNAGILGSSKINGRYVMSDDEVICVCGGWQCACGDATAR